MFKTGQRVRVISASSGEYLGPFDYDWHWEELGEEEGIEIGEIVTVVCKYLHRDGCYEVRQDNEFTSWIVGAEDLQPLAPPTQEEMEKLL